MLEATERGEGITWKYIKQTDPFKEFYRKAVDDILDPNHGLDKDELMQRLAGGFFELYAYTHLLETRFPGKRILSGEETLDYYKRLYPLAVETKHPFGGTSLSGISVPDGLVFGEGGGGLEYVCEYTLDYSETYSETKRKAITGIKEEFADFDSARLIFVVPSDTAIPDNVRSLPGIDIERVPYAKRQFGSEVDYLFKRFRTSEDAATLKDMWARSEVQKGRPIQTQHTR